MNPATLLWLGRLAIVASAIGFGYWIGAQHYGKQLATTQRDQALAINVNTNAARATEQQQQATVSSADKQHWQELTDAQAEIATLRRALAAGTRRVYVNADCTKRLPETASSSRVDHAEAVELVGSARQDYLDFRAAYASQRQQLMACQAIVNAWQQQR